MKKIKKGDEIIVIAGKDKGRRGIILSVVDGGKSFLVEGINTVKRHTKPNAKNDRGGIVIKTMPLCSSKVMIYNPATNKGARVGIRILEDGNKVRYFKDTNEVVDV